MSLSNRLVVVVGVDFSKTAELAVQRALELAVERDEAEIHIVNIVRTYGSGVQLELPGSPGFTGMSLGDAAEQLRLYAQHQLANFAEQRGAVESKPLPRVVTHIRLDAPAEEIAQLAADVDADLVIVGTHGRRGLSRMLMGSVAEGVVRLAPCAVLVVRPKEPSRAPHIEPPCAECVKTRRATNGQEFWCEQHRERHGQRHTYFSTDRVSRDGSMPLVFPQR